MISSAFHSGGVSSPKWILQAALLSAAGMWQFSFLESDKQEATCRLLQAFWDTAIPEAQRSSQVRTRLGNSDLWIEKSYRRSILKQPSSFDLRMAGLESAERTLLETQSRILKSRRAVS